MIPRASAPGRRRLVCEAAIAATAFMLIVGLGLDWSGRFAFSKDESFNVMKGMLVGRGHSLYGEIWSDQPPAFTYLLAGAFAVFGESIATARLVVLACSGALAGSIYAVLAVCGGRGAAIAGTAAFALLPHALVLSVSTLIGMPSLALAAVSLLLLSWWREDRGRLPLALSALCIAASVLTKFYTAPLLVIFAAGIVMSPRNGDGRRAWAAAAQWLTMAIAIIAGTLALTAGGHVGDQLLGPHLAARYDANRKIDEASLAPGDAGLVLALAACGAIEAVRQRSWPLLLALGWAVAGLIALARHHPIWAHHYFLYAVPCCMLAGFAAGRGWDWLLGLRRWTSPLRRDTAWPALLVAASLAALVQMLPDAVRTLSSRAREAGDDDCHAMVALMRERAGRTRWVATDRAIFAFRSGLPVPPELTLWSSKRGDAEDLGALLRSSVAQRGPELVLLHRYKGPAIDDILATRYRLVAANRAGRLYELTPGHAP